MNKYYINNVRWISEELKKIPFYQTQKSNLFATYLGLLNENITVFDLEYNKLVSCDNNNAYNIVENSIKNLSELIKDAFINVNRELYLVLKINENSGILREQLRDLEKELGFQLPVVPNDVIIKDNSTMYLGLRIVKIAAKPSIGILIPHWESYNFITLCIKYIDKFKNDNLDQKIYILDDDSQDGSFEKLQKDYKNRKDIVIKQIKRHNKKKEADVGLILDEGIQFVTEQYVAMIDADLFPLSKDWLSFPIKILETTNSCSVGLDTGLSTGYFQHMEGMNLVCDKNGYLQTAGVFESKFFTCTNNLYRIMRTSEANVVSKYIGFTRASDLVLNSKYWVYGKKLINSRYSKWFIKPFIKSFPGLQRLLQPRYPYFPGGEDNGVAANHFMCINNMGNKYNLPLTSYIGLTPKDGAFGQNICGLAFHFALSTRALSKERREVFDVGKEFEKWVDILQDQKGISEENLKLMIEDSKEFTNGRYDGSLPKSWYIRQYEFIQRQRQREEK